MLGVIKSRKIWQPMGYENGVIRVCKYINVQIFIQDGINIGGNIEVLKNMEMSDSSKWYGPCMQECRKTFKGLCEYGIDISGFMAQVIKIGNAVYKMFKYPHKMARILEGMKR